MRGDIARDDRTRADERLLADLDAGQQHRTAADACTTADHGPRTSALRFSVRPMKLSFVVTTQGAMKTSSSSVE